VWAYEPKAWRRLGERVLLGLVLVYLVVGVLAGENLRWWLDFLPEEWKITVLSGFQTFHTHNPFGTIRHWLETPTPEAWDRTVYLEAWTLAAVGLCLGRGALRLKDHFHERHYEPARNLSGETRPAVGDRPLSWWAVKRVTEYSGRVNLWLAGGFCALY